MSASASPPRVFGPAAWFVRTVIGCAVLLASCSSQQEVVVSVTEDDVVLAYVDAGMSSDVADCFVGLGQREFEFDLLLPGVAPESDRPLLDEMLGSCRDAVAMLDAEELPTIVSLGIGPFNIGDDRYLDELWVGCDRGDGAACDALWEEAPVGSIYEWFGVTCGNRPEVLNCTEELTLEEVSEDGIDDAEDLR